MKTVITEIIMKLLRSKWFQESLLNAAEKLAKKTSFKFDDQFVEGFRNLWKSQQ